MAMQHPTNAVDVPQLGTAVMYTYETPDSPPLQGVGTIQCFLPSDPVWVGIRTCEQCGNMDGTFNGQRLFDCQPGYGVLVPLSSATVLSPERLLTQVLALTHQVKACTSPVLERLEYELHSVKETLRETQKRFRIVQQSLRKANQRNNETRQKCQQLTKENDRLEDWLSHLTAERSSDSPQLRRAASELTRQISKRSKKLHRAAFRQFVRSVSPRFSGENKQQSLASAAPGAEYLRSEWRQSHFPTSESEHSTFQTGMHSFSGSQQNSISQTLNNNLSDIHSPTLTPEPSEDNDDDEDIEKIFKSLELFGNSTSHEMQSPNLYVSTPKSDPGHETMTWVEGYDQTTLPPVS